MRPSPKVTHSLPHRGAPGRCTWCGLSRKQQEITSPGGIWEWAPWSLGKKAKCKHHPPVCSDVAPT